MTSNNANSNKRIAKNTFYLYVRMVIVLGVSLYSTRIVLRCLGIEDYGIYNVVCGFVSMFSFLNASLSTSTNRFYNYEIGKGNIEGVRDVYNNSFRIQGGIAILILFVAEIVGFYYLNTYMVIPSDKLPTSNWIFQFSLISMFFTILQTPYIAIILAYERMNYYALVSIIDVLLKLLIALIIPYAPSDKLFLYGFLMMSISVANFFMYGGYAFNNFSELRLSKQINKPLLKSMVSFSGWSFLNPLAYTWRSQGCNLVLNFFFGTIVNAAYAITNQVASAIDSLSMSVSVAARPQLIQSYSSGDYVRVEKLFFSTSKIMFILIATITIPLAFNMDYLLSLWLGDWVPEYSSIFCIFILMNKLIDSLNPTCSNLIMATGKIKKYMIVSSICTFAIIPIAIIFLNLIKEPISLFFIMVLCTITNQFFSVRILHEQFEIISQKKYLQTIIYPCCLLFCSIVFSLYLTNKYILVDGVFQVTIDILITIILVIAISFAFILNNSEKALLKGFINKY